MCVTPWSLRVGEWQPWYGVSLSWVFEDEFVFVQLRVSLLFNRMTSLAGVGIVCISVCVVWHTMVRIVEPCVGVHHAAQ